MRIKLEEVATTLGAVTVAARSTATETRDSGYGVEVLETKQYKNLSGDLNQLLQITPGVNLRESGGLGSGFQLSLNGLSGNQVRYFLDGIPLDNFGPSLTLNNFPVNLVEKIEVYKGVVPVHLGADALGGAINVISATNFKNYLDVGYTVGSFGTHRVSISGRAANKANDAYLQAYAFLNHSENNYTVDSVRVFDLELGNLLGYESIERFHDQYTSGMINL
ncbi:MAG: TonB-dependent receptor plug domain-containing protein, partial [Bacteroidota bacterium]